MHGVNVFFHTINTLLLFLWLSRMTRALWPSALAAALFAVHPLHVESVAWIAERKDVLSMFFFLLTVWAYVLYVEKPDVLRYAAVIVLFALGLMAKPMVVTLPAVLLLLDYWPLGRLSNVEEPKLKPAAKSKTKKKRKEKAQAEPAPLTTVGPIVGSKLPRLLIEKIPLFGLAAASSVITYWVQHSGKAVMAFDTLPLGQRIGNALVAYMRYILMTICTRGLAAFYPHPGDSLPLWQVMVSALLLVAVTVLVVWTMRRLPYIIVGWLWFLGALVPVIGIIQVGGQALADRYTYIPHIGLFIIVAWGGAALAVRWRIPKATLGAVVGVVLVALTATAFAQTRHWRNSTALFEHALQVTTKNYVAHRNLGCTLQADNRLEEAIAQFRQGLVIKPDNSELFADLACALGELGRMERDPRKKQALCAEACEKNQEATQRNENLARAWYNWGLALVELGGVERNPEKKRMLLEEACEKYKQAAERDTRSAISWNNWSLARSRLADLEPDPEKKRALLIEACEKYEEAARRDPNCSGVWPNWSSALSNLADIEPDPKKKHAIVIEACEKSEVAAQRDADNVWSWSNWGAALSRLADLEPDPEKKRALLRAVCEKSKEATRRDPNHVVAWNGWGATLRRLATLENDPALQQKLIGEANEKAAHAQRIATRAGR